MDEKSWKLLIRIFAALFLVGAILVILYDALVTFRVGGIGAPTDIGGGGILLGGCCLGGLGLLGLLLALVARWRERHDAHR